MASRNRARSLGTILAAGSAGLLLLAGPAHAAVAAAGPGASTAGFATRVVVTPVGGSVTFVNGDVADHTLTASDAYLPKKVARKTAYCKPYPKRACPLFTTGSVGAGDSASVQGLDRLAAGEYPFRCQIHSGMTGTLVVAGSATTPRR